VIENDDAASKLLHHLPFTLIDRLQGIIAALHVDIRLNQPQKLDRITFAEYAYCIHALQGRYHACTVGFGVDGAIRSFQLPHSRVAIYPYDKSVTKIPCSFKIRDMPHVQQIEAPIGGDQSLASLSYLGPPNRNFVRGKKFFGAMHRAIVGFCNSIASSPGLLCPKFSRCPAVQDTGVCVQNRKIA
jgi:hypothetical protein